MYCCQIILTMIALVVPFGLLDRSDCVVDEIPQQLIESCADELADFSETEELKSFVRDVDGDEFSAQFLSRLAVFRCKLPATLVVDPLGRRPPPAVRIS